MKHKVIKYDEDRSIEVFDDVFSYVERCDFYKFALNSFFKMTGSDSSTDVSELKSYQIFSSFSKDDVGNMGFFNNQSMQEILGQRDLMQNEVKQFRVNASHIGEKNVVHNDGKGKTLVYCLNPHWKPEWGGHLMFLNDALDEPTNIVGYKAGRVTIFDGELPHSIITPTIMSPVHRFTFVAQFK